ncbi:MAG: hypothetical protein HY858_02470 [Candidatus Solibacter usitatus]|nr:hypothetical protein [Candidatus Solibacter usitatus]
MGIHDQKRQEMLDTPVLLFECTLADGAIERWASHRVAAEGHAYEPRVLEHGGFDLRLAGEEGIDAGSRFTVALANVDGRISQLDRSPGWKGAKLRVRFGFFDVETGLPVSELTAVFLGTANPVDELTETKARLSFMNRLSLQRLTAPAVRVQSRCPWRFPATEAERVEARDGGRYTSFYRCGYSAGLVGGTGSLNGGAPFTECGRTRADCEARGMFRQAGRYGGFAFIPEGGVAAARVNDAAPVVYGTAWMTAPVVFSRNDGNLTHCEVLLGMGPVAGVQKVIANGVELGLGQAGRDMGATGWYNVLSLGERNGGFNLDFADGQGNALGDPHGSMACLSVVVPNKLVTGGNAPKVEVLLDGQVLPRYAADRTGLPAAFTKSPAWVLLDMLRRSGWEEGEIDVASFAEAAAYCEEFVDAATPQGTVVRTPRFEVNLALTQRKSLSEIVRGIRTAASMMLTVDGAGRIALRPETTLARQQPGRSAVTNATMPLAGGWPAYEFGDGTNGTTGILRRDNGASTFRIWRRPGSEVANRLSVEFQDAFNQYQRDSLSLVDFDDTAAQGCETAGTSGALGLPHFDQAARILRLQIQKNTRGNHFVEFDSSVQAIGVRPGDLITVTHAREGLDRALYRVLRMTPGLNYERVKLIAQRHEDGWYELAAGIKQEWRPTDGAPGAARPLCGRVLGAGGEQQFEITETALGEGSAALTVRFTPPGRAALSAPAAPVVGLTPEVRATGGTLAAGTYWYAVSGVNADGEESTLSFTARAEAPAGVTTASVAVPDIRCGRGSQTMRVYRGDQPGRLLRIFEGAATDTFLDTGLAAQLAPPPDANFDHARFQWRYELVPQTAAGVFDATGIGNAAMGLVPNEYTGAAVRIMSGHGAGQERTVASNTATRLEVSPGWSVAPDATSRFTVAEAGWRPGGITRSDSLEMVVPYRELQTVQVTGVPVNALGVEGGLEEALVTRKELTGGGGAADTGVPCAPSFGLSAAGGGEIEVGGIGFARAENTRTIEAATLTLHYWDELASPSGLALGGAVGANDTALVWSALSGVAVADLVQLGGELVRVLEVTGSGLGCVAERAVHGTLAANHGAGTTAYALARHTAVLPFPRGFFGSPASGSYLQRLSLKSARVAAAEMFVTNSYGSSPTAARAYTMLLAGGLRTMSGGQYSIQYDGALAVMDMVAPPIVVEQACAVRDVSAAVGSAPLVEPVVLRVRVDGTPYCDLTIAAGMQNSAVVDGFGKRPIPEGAKLTVSVVSVGLAAGSFPGRDLTVTLRL